MSINIAMILAAQYHARQLDKAGRCYLGHLIRVAGRLALDDADPPLIEAALLHDAIEDGHVSLEKLSALGISVRALELIERLTRRHGESYDAYIARVKGDKDAVRIKLADLADNMDAFRLSLLPQDYAAKLLLKYSGAVEELSYA